MLTTKTTTTALSSTDAILELVRTTLVDFIIYTNDTVSHHDFVYQTPNIRALVSVLPSGHVLVQHQLPARAHAEPEHQTCPPDIATIRTALHKLVNVIHSANTKGCKCCGNGNKYKGR